MIRLFIACHRLYSITGVLLPHTDNENKMKIFTRNDGRKKKQIKAHTATPPQAHARPFQSMDILFQYHLHTINVLITLNNSINYILTQCAPSTGIGNIHMLQVLMSVQFI